MNTKTKFSFLILTLLFLPLFGAAHAADDSFDETVSFDGAITLDVGTNSGSIDITTGGAGKARIVGKVRVNRETFWRKGGDSDEILEYVLENPPIVLNGDTLEVGRIEDRAMRKRVSISYTIVVPADTTVLASTGSGSISVEDIEQTVKARTGSGRIELSDIGASASAKSGSGSIRGEGIAGAFEAKTGSGGIYLEQTAPGDVNVSMGSGSAELVGVAGALRARSGSGTIQVDGQQTGDWDIGTGSGSITVQLPDDAAFTLDAHSSSGGVNTDHPVTVVGKISKKHIRGDVRGGGPLLKIDTGSGRISIN